MIAGRRGQYFGSDTHASRSTEGEARQLCICVHAASLGEFEQGRPLIEALRARYPDSRLVLTFFSPSGYEVRKNYSVVDNVYYLPLDTPKAARRFARELKPDMVFFVKYEYWNNILRELKRVGARVYVVSAIFRPSMSFFRPAWRAGAFFRSILKVFDKIFVQDAHSAELLASIGFSDNVIVAGDTRFDRVARLVDSSNTLPDVESFVGDSFTVVCGSTWGEDEDLLLEAMAKNKGWKFIVAPHHIDQSRIDRFIAQSGRSAIRYSKIGERTGLETLLVVDCIGILSSLYRYGAVAYIGGGFGAGIHNTLEAATWGMPVIFGPKYEKFHEAVELIESGAARSITSSEELCQAMADFARNHISTGSIAKQYVCRNIGATDRILAEVQKSLG